MIGKDASTGQIRSWAFDPDGSFGEASWTRDGKKWTQESAGVLDDGSVLAATNILSRIDDDSFTFQSVRAARSITTTSCPTSRRSVSRASRAKSKPRPAACYLGVAMKKLSDCPSRSSASSP